MISIRRLEASDLARIAEIQAASLEAAGWQVEEYLERESWVVIADGAVAGFAIARATAPGDEYEL